MHKAKVQIISPILVEGEWQRSGQIEMGLKAAQAEEAKGTVEIVAIDDEPIAWPPCCSDH